MNQTVQPVTDQDFETQVLKSDKPVLVDFWATWCGPCRMIAPVVEQIAGEMSNQIKFVKMDIDQNPMWPQQLGIMSIPTLIVFKNGAAAAKQVGYRPNMKEELKEKLQALL